MFISVAYRTAYLDQDGEKAFSQRTYTYKTALDLNVGDMVIAPTKYGEQFVLGYKGYVQLALRSGYYKRINVMSVKVGELVRFDPLTEEIELRLIQDELEREKAPSIGYVATFEYLNGFRKTIYWSREKMEAHALRYSKGYAAKKGYTFWEKDFDAMAYKTLLRQLISKWGIMSIDMQEAVDADGATVTMGKDGSFATDYVETPLEIAPVASQVDKSTGEVMEDAPSQPDDSDAPKELSFDDL